MDFSRGLHPGSDGACTRPLGWNSENVRTAGLYPRAYYVTYYSRTDWVSPRGQMAVARRPRAEALNSAAQINFARRHCWSLAFQLNAG